MMVHKQSTDWIAIYPSPHEYFYVSPKVKGCEGRRVIECCIRKRNMINTLGEMAFATVTISIEKMKIPDVHLNEETSDLT